LVPGSFFILWRQRGFAGRERGSDEGSKAAIAEDLAARGPRWHAVGMRAFLLAPIGMALLAAGCVDAFGTKDAHQPGEPLGTYHLTAKQKTNTCGDGALGAPAVWEFDVKLAWQDGSLYWNSGGDVISGSLSADRKAFEIDADVIMNMRTAADHGKPACSIDRHDIAKGALALEGQGVKSASGALSYAFSPTAGSSCGDLVTAESPVLAALPCEMDYTFDAARTGP
jgi:hypothetical protein